MCSPTAVVPVPITRLRKIHGQVTTVQSRDPLHWTLGNGKKELPELGQLCLIKGAPNVT